MRLSMKKPFQAKLAWRKAKKVLPLHRNQKGQSLVESALVLVLSSFVFFGILQIALVFHADQVQQWATYAGARSRVVGFNDAVVYKAFLVGNIMNAGTMMTPQAGLSELNQVAREVDAIPLFIQTAGTAGELSPQLNYADWNKIPMIPPYTTAEQYTATVDRPCAPLRLAAMIPMLASSFGRTNYTIRSEVTMDNHFPLYLQVD